MHFFSCFRFDFLIYSVFKDLGRQLIYVGNACRVPNSVPALMMPLVPSAWGAELTRISRTVIPGTSNRRAFYRMRVLDEPLLSLLVYLLAAALHSSRLQLLSLSRGEIRSCSSL